MMRKYVKEQIINLLDNIKILKIGKNPFVLMYHRIIDCPTSELSPIQPGMYVTSKVFDIHLKYLKENFNIVPLSYLLDNYFKGKRMEGCCAITFDDGWADNYIYAFDVIKKYKINVSFFLSTSFIGTKRRFWSEEISPFVAKYAKYSKKDIKKIFDLPDYMIDIMHKQKMSCGDKITEIVKCLKDIDENRRKIFINKIKKNVEDESDDCIMMLNWEQVDEMYKSGLCSFYPHSHNHEVLTYLDEKEIEYEIVQSVETVKKYINKDEIFIFSYPSGRNNGTVVKFLKKYNIQFAVGTERGSLDRINGPFNINRIGIHNDISHNVHLFRYCLRP